MKLFSYFMLSISLYAWSMMAVSDALTVIFDSGETLPISPYMKVRENSLDERKNRLTISQNGVPIKYPVTTPGMKPGTVDYRVVDIPHFQTPLFIIGNDEFSKKCLASRIEELRKLGAMGILVEAVNSEEVVEIRALAKGLRIDAVSGEDIAQQLNLKKYPVLISKTGIEQ